jgi:flagellar M-ring protein FliF
VRTTHTPEGRVQRVNAIVILGFEASADELARAGQLARQALGLVPARGDTLNVYALPVAASQARTAAAVASPQAPRSIPRMQPPSPSRGEPDRLAFPPWAPAAVAAILLLLGVAAWRRFRRAPAAGEPQIEDFDAELDAARNAVLANPRVTADVIKLWMRA